VIWIRLSDLTRDVGIQEIDDAHPAKGLGVIELVPELLHVDIIQHFDFPLEPNEKKSASVPARSHAKAGA
jgi:hypothetical protein